ncbi:MAG: Fic family protein, partial [Burkholderiales bacterium]|nr:Fic family protein [Phycisphaerae bacterium]
ISEVTVLLGRLDGMALTLPDPTILIRSFVRREAQLSSYIENTFAKYDEIAEADRAVDRSRTTGQVTETLNAERAILAGVKSVNDERRPVNNVLIRQLHEVLLKDVRGHECRGTYRQKQVYIGNEILGIDAARFVPPASHVVPQLMDQFEQAWGGGDEQFALVRIAMLHYQFETIHPFEDGNGRLGRILTLLGLCTYGVLNIPLLNASIHFERNRQQYYDGLLRVSTHGDWAGWVAFFLEGLRVAAIESTQKLKELLSLQREYHALIRLARNSALLYTLIDHLFISPSITINQAADVMGVTYMAASTSVQKLLENGILRIRTAGKPTVYIADRILKAVSAEPSHQYVRTMGLGYQIE